MSHPAPAEVPSGPPQRAHSGTSVALAAVAVLIGALAVSAGLIVPAHFSPRGVVIGGVVGAVFLVGGLLALVEWADEEAQP